MELEIRVDADDNSKELDSLSGWLRKEDDLRGRIGRPLKEIGETELGSTAEVVTVTVGSASTIAALCRVLTVWLETRRSAVRVRVTTGDTTTVVEATNVREVMPLLEATLRAEDVP